MNKTLNEQTEKFTPEIKEQFDELVGYAERAMQRVFGYNKIDSVEVQVWGNYSRGYSFLNEEPKINYYSMKVIATFTPRKFKLSGWTIGNIISDFLAFLPDWVVDMDGPQGDIPAFTIEGNARRTDFILHLHPKKKAE